MLNVEDFANKYGTAAVDGQGVEAGPGTSDGRSGGGRGPERGWFAWLGRGVTAHPAKVAFGWLLVVAGLLGVSSLLGQPAPSPAESAQLPAGYESARAQAALDRAFGAPSSDATAVLVFSRADGRPLASADLVAARRVVAVLARFEARQRAAAWPVRSARSPVPATARPMPARMFTTAWLVAGVPTCAPKLN